MNNIYLNEKTFLKFKNKYSTKKDGIYKYDDIFVKELLFDSGYIFNSTIYTVNSLNDNKNIYDLFYENKDRLEENTGLKYKWQRLDNKKASRIKAIKKCDVTNQENWEECFKWFCRQALIIKKEFNKVYNKQ